MVQKIKHDDELKRIMNSDSSNANKRAVFNKVTENAMEDIYEDHPAFYKKCYQKKERLDFFKQIMYQNYNKTMAES